MARAALFTWEGHEYDHNPKSADWYWTLGIVSVALAIASILFQNYLFAVLILAAAAAIALHAAKEPSLHQFSLTDHGLAIGEEFHPFSRMKSFSVLEDIEGKLPPLLSIKTESIFSPHLEIPLDPETEDAVYAILLENVDEGEHHPSLIDLIAARLGF